MQFIRRRLVIGTLALMWAQGACPASDVPVPQHQQKFPVTSYLRETRWAPCAFNPKDPADRRAECAFVEVPLDYSQPRAGKFRVFVKRIEAREPESAQVWLLHGGPGASATEDLFRLSFGIPDQRPDISYYGVDHRGMGGSERIGCLEVDLPPEDIRGKWAACMQQVVGSVGLSRLNQITTSNAARDIGTLVAKYRKPGVRVIINGLSYGTTLAQRYLHLFPGQADGVVLVGLEASGELKPIGRSARNYDANWDRRQNDAIAKIFERCALATECARNFDRHPWQFAQETMRAIYQGHCAALGIEPDRIKETFGAISFANTPAALPALVTRLARCNEGDRALLRAVVERWYPSMSELGTATEARSDAAGNIISASEGEWNYRSVESLQREFSEELTIAYGVERFYVATQDVWPRYPRDEYMGRWPDYRGPILLIQGGLDTATTLAQAMAVRPHYAHVHQHWVIFPEGNHRILGHSPTLDGGDCGLNLFLQFIDAPQGSLDTSCLAQLKPIDWRDPAAARAGFGVDDLWNGVPAE